MQPDNGYWSITQIRRRAQDRGVTFKGGSQDGLYCMAPVLDDAQDGEVWCIYTSFEGEFAALVTGGCTAAHRTYQPVAEQFLAGETFANGPHCWCRINIVNALLGKIYMHAKQIGYTPICDLAHTASLVLTQDEAFLQRNAAKIYRDVPFQMGLCSNDELPCPNPGGKVRGNELG